MTEILLKVALNIIKQTKQKPVLVEKKTNFLYHFIT